MSTRLFLLLSFAFALLEGPLLPPVFFEGLLLVFFVLARPVSKVAIAALISGLIFDLLQNQHLGITSLIFVTFAFLLFALRERLQIQRDLALAILALLINVVRSNFVFHQLPFVPLTLSFLVSLLVLHFVWRPTTGSIKLR